MRVKIPAVIQPNKKTTEKRMIKQKLMDGWMNRDDIQKYTFK